MPDTGRAMAEENVELVRDAFQTFSAEGIDGLRAPPTADMTACEGSKRPSPEAVGLSE